MDVRHMIRSVIEFVNPVNGGILEVRRFACPVAGRGNHHHGPWSGECAYFHVARIEPDDGCILANASALHGVGNHVDGRGNLDALVDGVEREGLRATAGSAGAVQVIGIDIGKRFHEIEGANAGPQLD